MPKILITGSKGQLGRAITDLAADHPGYKLTGIDQDELDLCNDREVEKYIALLQPDVVVNCAAYTAVDQAEDDISMAYAVNSHAVKNLAVLSEKLHYRLIHVSTDYIFNGLSTEPYSETQITDPRSVYGQSKLEGEIAVLYHCSNAIIIRTSWLYYESGKNFVNTILKHAFQQKNLKVVYDQTGSPTYAGDLAAAILKIIETGKAGDGVEIFHYANSGVTTWYDFALSIIRFAGLDVSVDPVLTGTLHQRAKRPPYSVLNCEKIRTVYKVETPYWRDSLKKYMDKIQS
jgi:dTDP-4-dehydrorhamnose reductase